jgi:hypothetical protein
MVYYSAFTNKEMSLATTVMNLEDITLSAKSQSQKDNRSHLHEES